MAEPDANTDLGDAIARSADGPADVSIVGQGSSKEHPLPDQIQADRYLAAKRATRTSSTFGLRFLKISPPGTQ